MNYFMRGETMKYLMSGIEHQSDKGFGISAEAFKKSADFLIESDEFTRRVCINRQMGLIEDN